MNLPYWLRSLVTYLRTPSLIHATQSQTELREEIEFHLASSVEQKINSGLTPEASRQVALEKFGDLDSVFRQCNQVSKSGQIFWHRVHQGITALLALGMLWLAMDTIQGNRRAFHAGTGYPVANTHGDVTGVVIGDDGEPVSSAHIMAVVKTWPPNGYRQQSYMTTTNADGTFKINDVYSPNHEYEVQIAAVADGRLLTSHYTDMTTGLLDPYEIRMSKTTPFELRFETPDGQPIEGVAAYPASRIADDGQVHNVYAMGADPIVRRSGEAGNLSMPHFRPGERIAVSVQFPDDQWQRRELVIPKTEQVVVLTPEPHSRLKP